MAKVYVTNKSGHDYSQAEVYGQLTFLSVGLLPKYSTTVIYRQFAEILRNSSPEDYFLVTGPTVMSSIAAAILAYKHGRLNLLLYRNSGYIERTLILSELLGGENGE